MKLEDEIKQPYFQDDVQKLIINLLFSGKWVTNLISKQLKPHQITTQQYNVLRILRGQKGNQISVNAIADRMIDKMSNVSRLIDKLNSKELVVRKVNKVDRRQVDIGITNKGLSLVDQIEKKEIELRTHFNTLSESETTQLNSLLDKLRG